MVAPEKSTMPPAADDISAAEGMQCTDHPYRKNPGGICAFCLQEKLGKLVSSSTNSTPLFIIPHPSSSSSSPSFRSDYGTTTMASTATRTSSNPSGPGGFRRSKLSFLSATNTAHKKKHNSSSINGGKINALSSSIASSSSLSPGSLKRSKSVAPRPTDDAITTTTPRNKSFWSFLYHSSSNGATTSSVSNSKRRPTSAKESKCEKQDHKIANQEATVPESPGAGSQASGSSSSFGRKVARSRSVGCGSRSFSGDFLERISTGFGDCTLRRVESHREGNNHNQNSRVTKDRVNKCGGIFGGFGMISTSSSYWLSAAAAAAEEDESDGRIGGASTARASTASIVRGGRHRTWGWAFASPMRAFKPSPSSNNAVSSVNSSGSDGKDVNGGANGKVALNPSPLAVNVK